MIDATTHARIAVATDGSAGPYIVVPLDQLEAITTLLRIHHVSFWVDADAVSFDGKPEITVVNFGRGADAVQVQQLLDEAQ